MPAILAYRRLRQENCDFKTNINCIVRLYLKVSWKESLDALWFGGSVLGERNCWVAGCVFTWTAHDDLCLLCDLLICRSCSRSNHWQNFPNQQDNRRICHLSWLEGRPQCSGKAAVWPGKQVQALHRQVYLLCLLPFLTSVLLFSPYTFLPVSSLSSFLLEVLWEWVFSFGKLWTMNFAWINYLAGLEFVWGV